MPDSCRLHHCRHTHIMSGTDLVDVVIVGFLNCSGFGCCVSAPHANSHARTDGLTALDIFSLTRFASDKWNMTWLCPEWAETQSVCQHDTKKETTENSMTNKTTRQLKVNLNKTRNKILIITSTSIHCYIAYLVLIFTHNH